jgi:hypothetical protein
MNNEERYYLFTYFKENEADLDKMLLEDAGVNPS